MTIESPTLVEDDALALLEEVQYLRWTPIVAGAFAAAAFAFVLVTFGITIGLVSVQPHQPGETHLPRCISRNSI
jgi:hypothetical protein